MREVLAALLYELRKDHFVVFLCKESYVSNKWKKGNHRKLQQVSKLYSNMPSSSCNSAVSQPVHKPCNDILS